MKKLAGYTLARMKECIAQFVCLPICMGLGFSRVACLHEVKTKYFYTTIAQEMMLHTLPLTMLTIYNNMMLDKFETVDNCGIVFGCINLILNVLEICYYRLW